MEMARIVGEHQQHAYGEGYHAVTLGHDNASIHALVDGALNGVLRDADTVKHLPFSAT